MLVFKLSPLHNSHSAQGSRLESFVTLPRFLQAVPSLLVLTTAIAWGASSHAGGLSIDGGLHGATGVTVAAGPALGAAAGAGVGVGLGTATPAGVQATTWLNADMRAGANGNVTADQRRAATGEAGAGTGVQAADGVAASGAVSGAGEGVGRTAARTGKMAARGAKAEASGGLKAGAQGTTGSAGAAAGAKAGVSALPGVTLGN